MLDYAQEAWWSSILTPSSLITHLSISAELIVCHPMEMMLTLDEQTLKAKLTQWNDVVSSVNLTREEMFSVALLHILHDVVLQILTNTRQLRGQMDMILVSLASDYRYLFMYIMENGNQSKQRSRHLCNEHRND
ncbi:unnamed protein product [Rotaria sp. Silwood2]|nr:unnamed protein product [Rotaria sp. Silwood2]